MGRYFLAISLCEPAKLTANLVLASKTGCGYQAAILSRIAQKVYTIEIIPQLATIALRIYVRTSSNSETY